MYPSEKAVYDLTDKTLEVINVDVESEIAWKEGRLVFKETPLPEVLRCLANFYNVDFKVMDPVLDSYRLTGTFNNRQLSQILDYLRISSRMIIRKNGWKWMTVCPHSVNRLCFAG